MFDRLRAYKTTAAGVLLLLGTGSMYAHGLLTGTDSGVSLEDVRAALAGMGLTLLFSK